MPLQTSEAFVIDVRKMAEADRLVTFFTEEAGKIRGVAASAAKSRRRFGGKLERLSRVRVTYFEKEGRELARIDSCDLLEESFTLHQDLTVAATLSYVAELVDVFTHERESDPNYFRLLTALLAAVRAGGGPAILARYFETWTLRLHGLMPALDRCAHCGKTLAGAGARVNPGEMSMASCPGCARKGAEGAAGRPRTPTLRLSAEALAALERFRKTSPGDLKGGPALSKSAMAEVEEFTVGMLTSFTGHAFRSYGFLRHLAEMETP